MYVHVIKYYCGFVVIQFSVASALQIHYTCTVCVCGGVCVLCVMLCPCRSVIFFAFEETKNVEK